MTATAQTPRVALDHASGTVRVAGDGLPEVIVARTPGDGETNDAVPVGTRDPARLTLTVDGLPAVLRPAKGRLFRRSYRVDAAVDGVRYRLVPCSYAESRLTRDGRALGLLDSTGDGLVGAEWHDGVQPRDIALGTALAAAFGTGAAPWWEIAADAIGELIP
ncbi:MULTISPECIES: hypothetical protein [Streptomyces]|uniref:Uncharacterized protein n=1 Tax=Streptomyces solicathayae TaxID=3081768 RepID=A0ABZ0LUT9_9ACTN|nr:hypothetical protein [Streptomyces sp. HUAS YS2]WOX23075.1 hypothetical protein R2D22_17400 [Streptomyces sp. HUAS YS2]